MSHLDMANGGAAMMYVLCFFAGFIIACILRACSESDREHIERLEREIIRLQALGDKHVRERTEDLKIRNVELETRLLAKRS